MRNNHGYMSTPPSTSAQTPERTRQQRIEALQRANGIRTERARLKECLKSGEAHIAQVLEEPPEYLHTAKVFDLIMAVPKFGRVKTARILERCRVSPSKTVIGLTPRQRRELVEHLKG
ncbi:MAG: integration host factor, actinobacterial type [Thermoleophilia bacterium]